MNCPELLSQIAMADSMGKPTFPIMLSSIHIPKEIHNPVTMLRRKSVVLVVLENVSLNAYTFVVVVVAVVAVIVVIVVLVAQAKHLYFIATTVMKVVPLIFVLILIIWPVL